MAAPGNTVAPTTASSADLAIRTPVGIIRPGTRIRPIRIRRTTRGIIPPTTRTTTGRHTGTTGHLLRNAQLLRRMGLA